jgi:hypothetical protein
MEGTVRALIIEVVSRGLSGMTVKPRKPGAPADIRTGHVPKTSPHETIFRFYRSQ